MKGVYSLILDGFILVVFFLILHPGQGHALHYDEISDGKKVLVVASYHTGYKWVDEILRALHQNLPGANLQIFYMDTIRNFVDAEAKAEEAFQLYLDMKPDAVIAIDDNAQKFFVVPYLKDKVKTPVIFCGVNDDATQYGFPASNVTGVVEKQYYREGIHFAKIIDPTLEKIAVMYRKSPSNDINLAQIKKENSTYSVAVTEYVEVNTLAEARKATVGLAFNADALLLLNMTGILDTRDRQMEGHDVIKSIAGLSKIVTIGANDWEVEAGVLCGVIKSGEEQGALAAEMLHSIWEGKSVQDLPVTQNKNGQRFLNVNTLKKLDLKVKPEMIIGARIVVPH